MSDLMIDICNMILLYSSPLPFLNPSKDHTWIFIDFTYESFPSWYSYCVLVECGVTVIGLYYILGLHVCYR